MFRIKQAVILAGGKGTRLLPLTQSTPKPMVKINGKPFLEYTVRLLKKNGIKKILILVGYQHSIIENYFKNGKSFGVEITYSYSPVDVDTGSRLKNAESMLENNFLLLYGDNYWPLDLTKLLSFYDRMHASYLVTIYSNFDNTTKNNIRVKKNGIVDTYDKTRVKKGLSGVDIGYFILDKHVISLIPDVNSSFEKTVLPEIIRRKQLAGFVSHHKYYSLTTPERIPAVERYFQNNKTVFLDRDGVINKKALKGEYITTWEKFVFLPQVIEALLMLQEKGYSLFIVSNQAGIARGVMTKKQLEQIHRKMINQLIKTGIIIQGIYVCIHGWNDKCFCRKPSPGLFYAAAADHNIDLYTSYCIGDDPRDIIAGKSVGSKTFLVTSKNNLYSIVKKYL